VCGGYEEFVSRSVGEIGRQENDRAQVQPAFGDSLEDGRELPGRTSRRDVLRMDKSELRKIRGGVVSYIFQEPSASLNPVFRVGTQLLETTRSKAGAEGRAKANIISLLKSVQFPDPEGALDRYPHQFSGGQRQRLLIAAALASSPAIVLADEPTTALDVTTQLQILKLLRGLAEARGLSMLFVSHDFGVVAQLCDTVTVMYAGQTVESGPVRRILAAPLHPYTRMLLACHPDRGAALAGIPGTVSSPLRPPAGCRFHPRCPSASPECENALPPRTKHADHQDVQCVLYRAEAEA